MSGENGPNRRTVVDFQSLSARYFQSAPVESHHMQDRRVDVSHIVRILHGMKSQLIGRAVDYPFPDSGSRQPNREAMRMMFPSRACPAPGFEPRSPSDRKSVV